MKIKYMSHRRIKMNKKQILTALKNAGYTGDDSLDNVQKFIDTQNINIVDAEGKSIDLPQMFKAVTITVAADAGEEVSVNGMELENPEIPMEEPEMDNNMCDKPRKSVDAVANSAVKNFATVNSETAFARKAYNRNAQLGKTFFADADEAEVAGAFFRMKLLGHNPDGYAQKANDLAILGKSWTTGTGGMVPTFIENYIQENLFKFGTARRVVGDKLHRMRSLTLNLNDLTSDAVVSVPGEGVAATATNAATPAVTLGTLTAVKAIGTKKISNELLADSPLNVADYIGRAFARAIAKIEDDYYFVNTGANLGAFDKAGAGALATVSATWTSVTDAQINAVFAKLHEGYNHSEAAIVCTRAYYYSVFYRLMKAAGGVSLSEAINGAKNQFPQADASWYGYPVYFASDTQLTAVSGTPGSGVANRPFGFGVWGEAVAMGYVDGSMEIGSSADFAFNEDVIVMRAKSRFAVRVLNVGGASTTGGVAFGSQA